MLVWGLFGGAITRIAALKFTRDEAPGLLAALKHAARKVAVVQLAAAGRPGWAGVFAIQLVVLGWLMQSRRPGACWPASVWPFVLLLGLLMAILLLGALVGWPLMWATVSVEGTDAFDALSRSYAYTYHRPLRLLWYVLFAALLGRGEHVRRQAVCRLGDRRSAIGRSIGAWMRRRCATVVAPDRLPLEAPMSCRQPTVPPILTTNLTSRR